MLSILAEDFYVVGIKYLLRQISRNCVICQKAYARVAAQRMGLLPITRVKPSPPFAVTGIDYAGPLLIRRGHARKPTLLKSYAGLFICCTTKAVHIELVSDLTSEAFLATLFLDLLIGEAALLQCCWIMQLILLVLTENFVIYKFTYQQIHTRSNSGILNSTSYSMEGFSKSFTPLWWYLGGRNKELVLKKIAGRHYLTFEQLCTVLTAAECTLNSRPLFPVDSTSPDGMSPLTPGHFLIGQPLRSLPTRVDTTSKLTSLHHWELAKWLKSDVWTHWCTLYLQALQRRDKWQLEQLNLQHGDIVLLKEIDSGRTYWPLARIFETYPGDDGCVRVVKIFCCGHEYKRAVQKLVPLVRRASHSASLPRECVQA